MTKIPQFFRYNIDDIIWINRGIFMYVKLFDENHELDLEKKVNDFLQNYSREEIVDIRYQVATLYDGRSQIYCYSCMIIIDDEA